MKALHKLESQVKESIEELPVDIDSSGGIDIQLSEQELEKLEQTTSDRRLQSSKLIDRYKNTLEDMEKTTDELNFIPTVWPAESKKVTSEFGVRNDPFNRSSSFHTGRDL